jgi:hypothetical protein
MGLRQTLPVQTNKTVFIRATKPVNHAVSQGARQPIKDFLLTGAALSLTLPLI